MVKVKSIIVSIVVILIVFLIFFVSIQHKEENSTEVFIPKGSSLHKIATILKDNNIITYPKIFVCFAKFSGNAKQLQAGLYDFKRDEGFSSIINKLRNGSSKNIKITIPEGFNIKQIAEILHKNNICDSNKFIYLALQQNMEGYLFPNTYFLIPQTDEQEIIKIMNNEFNKYWTVEKEERLKQIKKTKKDIIILASIVEKEAVADFERPIIAGVFINRLSKKMRLESCSTVLYAMGINKERLSFDDLKFDSPYNTYRYSGLPPGPICNPGAKSIDAVLYPQITDKLYFVSKGNGTHYFSSTFEQHVKNKIVSKKKA